MSLRFCLADGNALTDIVNDRQSAETIAMRQDSRSRDDISQQTVPAMPKTTYQQAAKNSSGGIFKVILVLIGLGIFAVLAVAVGVFIYYNMNRSEVASNLTNREVKLPTPVPTKDDSAELRDQIANLEKLISEQKNNKQPINIPFTDKSGSTKTARIDSPNDGFLALRTLPNSEFGERILKIPHGATVTIGVCGPIVRPVKRAGRWCQANYNGYTGWVFDAFLVY